MARYPRWVEAGDVKMGKGEGREWEGRGGEVGKEKGEEGRASRERERETCVVKC